jgi:VIT1/CCC1 family predicted Fe2+/Mn2+ transporter
MSRLHHESHRMHRINWLRAAVLGANDGIISTASLILGVAASDSGHHAILIAGLAGLIAGAMSMAAGEYVSVQAQSDTEQADIARERQELEEDPAAEHRELTAIYVSRGLKHDLASEVAAQLSAHDALATHAREELGITELGTARPVQAAWTSALSFASGALLPLIVAAITPEIYLQQLVAASSLVGLMILGGLASRAGGASMVRGSLRVAFWGVAAMAATSLIGWAFGTVV